MRFHAPNVSGGGAATGATNAGGELAAGAYGS